MRVVSCNRCPKKKQKCPLFSKASLFLDPPPAFFIAKVWYFLQFNGVSLIHISEYLILLPNNMPARVESVYTTPKIFGVEFETPRRSGVRLFIFTSVGASRQSTYSTTDKLEVCRDFSPQRDV